MKKQFFILTLTSLGFANPPQASFTSTVQLAVQESSPALTMRSQQVVMEQIVSTMNEWEGLRLQPMQIKTAGNEVIFIMNTQDDLRAQVQNAVAKVIDRINGKVSAKGRSAYYKTAYSQPLDGYLEVVMDEVHSRFVSISAQSVPLRDLLKEIKHQMNGNLSYLIPGECAERLVDWSFGEENRERSKDLDSLMMEIATLFGMKSEKKNGTFIFTGTCSELPRRKSAPHTELLGNSFFTGTHNQPERHIGTPIVYRPQVFMPLVPIGE